MGVRDLDSFMNAPLLIRGELDKPSDVMPRGVPANETKTKTKTKTKLNKRKATKLEQRGELEQSGQLEKSGWLEKTVDLNKFVFLING